MTRLKRYRRISAVAVAVLTGFALAGCVGIPSSGGVNLGGVIKNNDNSDSSFVDQPLGPPRDASKANLLTDFMQAETSPDGDYMIAKQYLTKKAAQHWNPSASVLIREGSATQHSQPDDVIDYSVTTKASVDSAGVYSEQSRQSTQSLTFTFKKVAGQWRISGLADGTVVLRSSFDSVFSPQPLYFFDPAYKFLVPDVRWFPNGATVQTRIVSALLGGPAPWLQNGVVASAFPAGVTLVSPVNVGSTRTTVDLSSAVGATKNLDRQRMVQQLTRSLQNTNAGDISVTVRGAPLQVTDSSTSDIATTALSVDSSPLLRSGKRFGFAPRLQEIDSLSSQIVDLGPTAVTVGRDQETAAALAAGGVYLVSGSATKPRLIDARPSLIAPSIDPEGYVWSVPATDASAIYATDADGVAHMVTSAIPSRSTIVALAVSHDGTRVLLYLETSAGPLLDVAGIVRRGGIPDSLGPLLELPVSSADPIDATWVDDRSVAALSTSDGNDTVTTYMVGGTSSSTTTTEDAVHIVGGSGADNLRVITSSGEVQQLRSSGWQNTGLTGSLLATQQ